MLGRPEIVRYRVGHDCGTVINPKIVRGMTMGGIAHGIGAALYEEFAYNDDGQLIAQTFMDYLLPSSHEVPDVEIIHHETPSPNTVFGQKGSGESGYLGAPAAIANAINDALRPLGISTNPLPIKVSKLGDMIAAGAEEKVVSLGRKEGLLEGKLNDRRRACASGAAGPADRDPQGRGAVSERAADRGRRQPGVFVRRRQADAAGVEAAVGYPRPPRLDGQERHRQTGGRRLGRHVRL